jgi:hypothetical protein
MTFTFARKPPKSGIDYPLSELFQLNTYVIKGDDLDYGDTSPHEMFDIPANTVIIGLGYKVVNGFATSGGRVSPSLIMQDTGASIEFGRLTGSILGDSGRSGFINMWYESTGDIRIQGIYDTGGASTQGKCELWLMYRPRSGQQDWITRA